MKKHLLLFLIFIISISVSHAQHFEWAASMGKAQTETLASVMDSEGNITQVVSWIMAYNTRYDEGHLIFDAFGDTIKLNTTGSSLLVVVQFDKNGKHKWHKAIAPSYGRGGITDDVLLSVNNKNELSVFVHSSNFYAIDDAGFWPMIKQQKFFRNKSSYRKGLGKNGEYNYEDETDVTYLWEGLMEFKLNSEGKLLDLRKILPEEIAEPHSVIATDDGGNVLVCSSGDDIILEGAEINADKGGAYILIKLDESGNIQWSKPFYFMKNSCCSYIMPYPKLAKSPNGNIFIAGAMSEGIVFPNGKKENFVTKADTNKYDRPFQGFVAAFKPDGKMLWQKTTGGKNTIHSLYVNNEMVYLSGRSRLNTEIFGEDADTSKGKNGFLVALDAGKGKTKWLVSNSTDGFLTLTQDTEGNLYGVAEYSAHKHAKLSMDEPCVFEKDTIDRWYKRMLIASYTNKGEYRWMKNTTAVLFQRSHYYNLLINDCNNLFLTGSAFAGLKIPSQYLDGAFMKGEAYGSMAYLSKIKNNTNQLDTNTLVKQEATDKNKNPLFQYREVAGKAIEGQEGCGVSPGPWQMVVYPNPFDNEATIKIKTTYDDNSVSLMLMDMKGQTISEIFISKKLEKGVYTYPINALSNHLSKGTYLVILRGSATILSERVIYK